jgi:hypothetical protein
MLVINPGFDDSTSSAQLQLHFGPGERLSAGIGFRLGFSVAALPVQLHVSCQQSKRVSGKDTGVLAEQIITC